jgi:His-Xaa-Ser system radical SAM maturase HxsB
VSAFQPLAYYSPLQQLDSYSLLPLRFERLSPTKVLVTNMVGEAVILGADRFSEFVGGQLSPHDPSFARLRSKHLLRVGGEQSPIDLLALKTRTKFERLRHFTSLHIFVVTLRCDHSCQYCQVSRQSADKVAFDMTRETADKALELTFRSPNPAIKIEFQGGEPLLNFDMVRYIVERAELMNRVAQRNLQFVIATTLSLATDEILSFCREHKILLSTSLDGPADLHNANRPRPGRDSHERFAEGLARTRDQVGVDAVSALMTTSPRSLGQVKAIIDEYVSHGFDGIFLRHLSPYGFALKTKSYQAYGAERWLTFYKEGLDYIIELNKRGVRFSEQYSTLLLTKMLSSGDPGFVDLMNPAGAGIAAVVFNYEGDVYASDESRMLKEMGDDTFKLGNVHTHTYEQIYTAPQLLDALEQSFTQSAPMCADCAFEPWCGAEPIFHHATTGDVLGRKPESDFCRRTMGTIKYLLEKMEGDPAVARIFESWVSRC